MYLNRKLKTLTYTYYINLKLDEWKQLFFDLYVSNEYNKINYTLVLRFFASGLQEEIASSTRNKNDIRYCWSDNYSDKLTINI